MSDTNGHHGNGTPKPNGEPEANGNGHLGNGKTPLPVAPGEQKPPMGEAVPVDLGKVGVELPAQSGPSEPGDSGGIAAPLSTLDYRNAQRALQRRWPLTSEHRARLVDVLYQRAISPETKLRDSNQAIRTIIAVEQQNIDDERHADGGERLNLNVSLGSMTPEQLKAMPLDELVRLHRGSLAMDREEG